jgi:hypothetical protein
LGGKLASDADLAEVQNWFLQHWDRIQSVFQAAPDPTVVRGYADGTLKVESEETDV